MTLYDKRYEKFATDVIADALNQGRLEDVGERRLEQLEVELAGDLEEAVREAFARVHGELEDAEAFAVEVREDGFRSRGRKAA